MAYEIGTIGGLFDGMPNMPIDPSWLPPNTQVGPDGKLQPSPPPPEPYKPSIFANPAAMLLAGVAFGMIAGYMQWGRR